MNLKDTLFDHTLHCVRINAEDITPRSVNDSILAFPYAGISADLMDPKDAFISVCICHKSGVRLTLCSVSDPTVRFPIEASVEEKVALLDSILLGDEDCGLTPYWAGFFSASYLAWKDLVLQPLSILPAFHEVDADVLRRVEGQIGDLIRIQNT